MSLDVRLIPEGNLNLTVTITVAVATCLMGCFIDQPIKAGDGVVFKRVSSPFAPESLNVTLHGNKFLLYVPSVEYDFNGINSD